MRRIPQQVPELIGRLLKAQHLRNQPTWYPAVMANPPPILPPYESRPRPPFHFATDTPEQAARRMAKYPKSESSMTPWVPGQKAVRRHGTPTKVPKFGAKKLCKPRKIIYPEDSLRTQFFKDFPFEAMRPVSLVELRKVQNDKGPSGLEWTHLRQRGDYPTVENVIAYMLNLIESREMLWSEAYNQATKQFVQLRAGHEMSTMAAELEARYYGANFKMDQFERYHMQEGKALDGHLSAVERGETAPSTRVKWKNPRKTKWSTELAPGAVTRGQFTGGQAYVNAWRRRKEEQVVEEPVEPELKGAFGSAPTPKLVEGEEADKPMTLLSEDKLAALYAPQATDNVVEAVARTGEGSEEKASVEEKES